MGKKVLHYTPSVVLYTVAALLSAYTIWACTYCADIIAQAKAAGQLAAKGNGFDIVSFYMGNCGQYVVSALLLVAAGILLQRKPFVQHSPDVVVQDPVREAADAELEEWFDEAESSDEN